MARTLTQFTIDNLKPAPSRREIPDGKESGLYFIVQPTGVRAWAFRYRVNGQSRKLTIGTYPAINLHKARAEAARAKGALADGVDPAATKQAVKAAARAAVRRTNDTVDLAVEDFLRLYAKPNQRDWRETGRLLAEFAAAWKGRALREITKADIHKVLDKVVSRGSPVTANRKLSRLKKMCKWAMSRGLIDSDPCSGILPPSAEKSRDRVLSPDELRLVWAAADKLGFPFGPIVKLLVLTGQRRGEVGGMEWNELDLEGRLWTIPAARSKNGRQHSVPLSPQAIEIIKRIPKFAGSKFIFSPGKTAPSGFSKAKERLDKLIARDNGSPILPWIMHDIRRSMATGVAGLGVNLPVIERLLNHVSGSFGGVVGIYQRHSFADEMRDAMERWGQRIESLTNPESSKIIELAAARVR